MKTDLTTRFPLLIAAIFLMALLPAGGRQAKHASPIVVIMAPPTYPMVARQARIEGVVHLEITTDGQRVASMQVQGNPPLLLADLAEKNVRTWRFEPAEPTTFTVTYTYKLVRDSIRGADETSVTLMLPTVIEISATVPVDVLLPPDK